MSLLEVQGLKHYFTDEQGKTVKALDGIDMSIQDGDYVAIIGESGSGKSTLARHLNALLLPTEGRVLVAGLDTREEANLWAIRSQVGMVFQNPDNQIVAAVVEEDVAFGPENLGIPQPELGRRVEQALATVDMSAYAQQAPYLLSGGQKQRVAIAGILAMACRCIVLDEPTAMLDPRGRQEVLATVKKLNQEQGITIVYITHDMGEALAAKHVYALEQGRVALAGTPEEVFCQVAELERLGLEAPLAGRLAARLRRAGLNLAGNIIRDEELAEALWP